MPLNSTGCCQHRAQQCCHQSGSSHSYLPWATLTPPACCHVTLLSCGPVTIRDTADHVGSVHYHKSVGRHQIKVLADKKRWWCQMSRGTMTTDVSSHTTTPRHVPSQLEPALCHTIRDLVTITVGLSDHGPTGTHIWPAGMIWPQFIGLASVGRLCTVFWLLRLPGLHSAYSRGCPCPLLELCRARPEESKLREAASPPPLPSPLTILQEIWKKTMRFYVFSTK